MYCVHYIVYSLYSRVADPDPVFWSGPVYENSDPKPGFPKVRPRLKPEKPDPELKFQI